jgi:hypothetical protein
MRETVLFCCLLREQWQRPRILPEEHRQKERAGDQASEGTIASPHHHEEYPSWCVQAYQKLPAGAIFILGCQAPLDCLRLTEVVCGRLFYAALVGLGERATGRRQCVSLPSSCAPSSLMALPHRASSSGRLLRHIAGPTRGVGERPSPCIPCQCRRC